MTNKIILLLWSAVILLFISCGEQDRTLSEKRSKASSSGAKSAPANDTSRMVIKTAEIKLQVDDVSENIKTIQSTVHSMNGHVIHYEVNSNRQYQQEIAWSLDSGIIINNINPQGFMKVKVPTEQSDSFIHAMLSMNASIDKLLVDEEDVTEDLSEKADLADMDSPLETKPTHLKETVYADHKNEVAIMRKADYNRLDYRTKYLWFDIYLQGHTFVEKTKTATMHDLHEPFYVNAFKAIEAGGYAFSIFLVALLHVWPFILLIILFMIAYKRKWFRVFQKPILTSRG